MYAKNLKDTANAKNIKITAGEKVNIHNSGLHAQKDIDIAAVTSDNKLTGEVIISSDLNSKGKSQTLIAANNNLSIQGANTKLDNAAVVYDTITFYGKDTTGQNNVTVANNTTFSPLTAEGKVSRDVTLETNGDFIMDNATMKAAAYSLKFDRNADGTLYDNKTVDAVSFKTTINTADINNLTV